MQQAAAQTYAQVAQKTVSPRELEATLLIRSAARLQSLVDTESKDRTAWAEAIRYNRQLWVVFATSVARPENPLPDDIKNNIANLAVFIFKQGMRAEARRSPDTLRSLISINQDIAAGLRANG